MGFWIILMLITCGGLLVVVVGSRLPDSSARIDRPATQSGRGSTTFEDDGSRIELDDLVPVLVVMGDEMRSDAAERIDYRVTGAKLSLVRHPAIPAAVPPDSVVVLTQWADVFLAGVDLNHGLDEMASLLDDLSDCPALAVVGSIPAIAPSLAGVLEAPSLDDVPDIGPTITVWNDALEALAASYGAEWVDLSTVAAEVRFGSDGSARTQPISVVSLDDTIIAATPAILRAVERIRRERPTFRSV